MSELNKASRDLTKIRDYLYLGCQAAEQSLEVLQELGITHVVQVGTCATMQPSHRQALEYCCVAAMDVECEDLLAKLKEQDVHSFISTARRNSGIVLVHCLLGVSRSATTVISWLMMEEGLSFEGALADVIARRPRVEPNSGFCDQLTIFQDRCGSKLQKYTTAMFKNRKEGEEMSERQRSALLGRARAAAEQQNAEKLGKLRHGLAAFAQRQEERRRRGQAGGFQGCLPPADEEGGIAT